MEIRSVWMAVLQPVKMKVATQYAYVMDGTFPKSMEHAQLFVEMD